MAPMAWRMIHLTLGLLLLHTVAATCPPSYRQKIMMPLTSSPCSLNDTNCEWSIFSKGVDVMVVDAGFGSGQVDRDSNLLNMIREVRAKRLSGDSTITSIVGTVYLDLLSNMTARKEAIRRWNTFYQVDGIFFDEVSTLCNTRGEIATLVKYVRDHSRSPSRQHLTIVRWGLNGPECFLKTSPSADIFLTIDGDSSAYEQYAPLPYMKKYSPARWSHIVSDVPKDKLLSILKKTKSNRAGWVLVSDRFHDVPTTGDNGTYWKTEVKQVASSCVY